MVLLQLLHGHALFWLAPLHPEPYPSFLSIYGTSYSHSHLVSLGFYLSLHPSNLCHFGWNNFMFSTNIHAFDLPTNGNAIRLWNRNHYPIDGATTIKQDMFPSTTKMEKLEHDYLQLHYSLAHIHSDWIQVMVQQGTLLARFKKCWLPFCASCAYGKATCKPWRSNSTSHKDEVYCPQKPGECISVYQLISLTPDFIAQMNGKQ